MALKDTHTACRLACRVVSQGWGEVWAHSEGVWFSRLLKHGCCVGHWAEELEGTDMTEVAMSGIQEWMPPCSCVHVTSTVVSALGEGWMNR